MPSASTPSSSSGCPWAGSPLSATRFAYAGAFWLLVLLLSALPALAETLFIEADESLLLTFPSTELRDLVPPHRTACQRQEHLTYGAAPAVRITTQVKELIGLGGTPNAEIPDEIRPYLTLGSEEAIPAEVASRLLDITAPLTSQLERTDLILADLAQRITPTERAPGSTETALQSLERGSASCAGRSNLAAGMLKSCRIPVRHAYGVLFRQTQAQDQNQTWRAGYHRWIETWHPDLGWLPSDPGVTHLHVGARYLTLWTAASDAPAPGGPFPDFDQGGWRIVSSTSRRIATDRRQEPRHFRLWRTKAQPVQYTSAVFGSVSFADGSPVTSGQIRWRQEGRWLAVAVQEGGYSLLGLPSGSYQLWYWASTKAAPLPLGEVRVEERVRKRQALQVQQGP